MSGSANAAVLPVPVAACAEQVAAGEQQRDGRALHGRGFLVAERGHGGRQRGHEAERVEPRGRVFLRRGHQRIVIGGGRRAKQIPPAGQGSGSDAVTAGRSTRAILVGPRWPGSPAQDWWRTPRRIPDTTASTQGVHPLQDSLLGLWTEFSRPG